jgi:hypothetical protein
MSPKTHVRRIRVGTRFSYAYLDSEPTWEVVEVLRRGVYRCHVVADEWQGTERVFAREEVERALALQARQEEDDRRQKDFYASLEMGQVVHYHDGFGCFIRCEVVRAPEGDRFVRAGDICLREIALVGAWRAYDLEPDSFRRRSLGKLMRPHALNVYENPRATDPRPLQEGEPPGQAASL